MGRLLTLLALGFGVWWLAGQLGIAPSGLDVSGREVRLAAGDLEYRFSRQGPLADRFMLFGGDSISHRNSPMHAIVSTLPLHHAQLIAQSYPDFYMCKSPGAAQAQAYVESMALITASRRVRGTLEEAIDLFEKRLRSGGERTCIGVKGAALSLESVSLRQDGTDISDEVVPGLTRSTRFYLAEEAELLECGPLLR